MALRDDLAAAYAANMFADKACPACTTLAQVEDADTKADLEGALAGTIGAKKLSQILARNGHQVSARQIMHHRNEKRTP